MLPGGVKQWIYRSGTKRVFVSYRPIWTDNPLVTEALNTLFVPYGRNVPICFFHGVHIQNILERIIPEVSFLWKVRHPVRHPCGRKVWTSEYIKLGQGQFLLSCRPVRVDNPPVTEAKQHSSRRVEKSNSCCICLGLDYKTCWTILVQKPRSLEPYGWCFDSFPARTRRNLNLWDRDWEAFCIIFVAIYQNIPTQKNKKRFFAATWSNRCKPQPTRDPELKCVDCY